MTIELSTLGENIRRVRRSKNITQGAMADLCSIHRTYFCAVERGRRNLSFGVLLKIARGLGTTISELTRNVDPGVPPSAEASNYAQPQVVRYHGGATELKHQVF